MGSRRFPGKSLAPLAGAPMIDHVLRRAGRSSSIDSLVVATSTSPSDDVLAAHLREMGFEVVRGDEEDVLARFATAADATNATHLVRVTGDCPLVDPTAIDLVVNRLLEGDVDYVCLAPGYPDGTDVEAFSRSVLDSAVKDAELPSDREHVTLWMRKGGRCATAEVNLGIEGADVRLSVDERADLSVVDELIQRVGPDASIGAYVAALNDTSARGSMWATRDEGRWRSETSDLVASIGIRNGTDASRAHLRRALELIPGGTQTLSKGAAQFVRGVTPAFLIEGRGAYVADVDGNWFIDYPMALGPVILGHGHPRTVRAVTEQVARGTTFTLPHPLELDVAEQIVDVVPCAEMVRFAKNGSDVTDAAVRLARAVTGKDVVLACGYHGWHDWYVVTTPRSAGVPEALRPLTQTFLYNDVESLEAVASAHKGRIAAVVLEVQFDDPDPAFIAAIRRIADSEGAVFVLDEIVTGFRLALGGAQERFGIDCDIACLGKALANGLPLAAVVGRRDLMESFDRVFFSGTFGGEVVSLVAAAATIEEMRTAPVIEHLWAVGERLHRGMRREIEASGLDIDLVGQPPKGALFFSHPEIDPAAVRGLFLQETVKRGILFGGPILTSYAHTEVEIDRTIEVCGEALAIVAEAVDSGTVETSLEGPAPGVVFRLQRDNDD